MGDLRKERGARKNRQGERRVEAERNEQGPRQTQQGREARKGPEGGCQRAPGAQGHAVLSRPQRLMGPTAGWAGAQGQLSQLLSPR